MGKIYRVIVLTVRCAGVLAVLITAVDVVINALFAYADDVDMDGNIAASCFGVYWDPTVAVFVLTVTTTILNSNKAALLLT